jgi:ActR/RegA family two-component response regulator
VADADAVARKARLLFVDDEESLRQTMPLILAMHGFEVTVAGTVAEALAAIQHEKFDVLLADLNVGQPGDGFTIVSAMRRTQPNAVTLILTGYPAFDTALEAIRKQVDGYVVKPADIANLLTTIGDLLKSRPLQQGHQAIVAQRAPRLVAGRAEELGARWIRAVRASAISSKKVRATELSNDAARLVEWLVNHLESDSAQKPGEQEKAREYGAKRAAQGYSLQNLVEESSLLRRELFQIVEQNLLAVEISYVVADLAAMNKLIDSMLAAAVEGHIAAKPRPRRSAR